MFCKRSKTTLYKVTLEFLVSFTILFLFTSILFLFLPSRKSFTLNRQFMSWKRNRTTSCKASLEFFISVSPLVMLYFESVFLSLDLENDTCLKIHSSCSESDVEHCITIPPWNLSYCILPHRNSVTPNIQFLRCKLCRVKYYKTILEFLSLNIFVMIYFDSAFLLNPQKLVRLQSNPKIISQPLCTFYFSLKFMELFIFH